MDRQQKLLSDMAVYGKYARYLPKLKRREVASEILHRYHDMLLTDYAREEKNINWAMQYAYDKKIVPSMRAMQFSGKPIALNNNRMYNCAYMPMDDPKAFSELIYLLLGGTGVGYSVQDHHIENLPRLMHIGKKDYMQYDIDDSIEGWADAVNALIMAYMHPKAFYPIFNFDNIREKGKPIETAGGFAPGPEPLREALFDIENILYDMQGFQLKPIDVFDINNLLAQAVYSGGIRRSATIALFSKDNKQMLYSKSDSWWEVHPERAMANISAVLPMDTRKDEYEYIFEITKNSGSGEPGFYWTNDINLGVNPCGEISLRPNTFCNMTEVNVSAVEDQNDFHNACIAATILGTYQAGYLNLKNLRPTWTKNTKEDSLIGVSLTGIAAYEKWPFVFSAVLSEMKRFNREIAENIGINPAKRLTTIKPSGTASLYFGTSSGIHPFYAPYYIRRMRVNKDEKLCSVFKEINPDFIEQDVMAQNQMVISIPIKAPENSITSEETALDMLKRIRYFSNAWVKQGHISGENTNNVSATVYVKRDEWFKVKQWLWDNREHYHGLTLLPFDNTNYKQTPFEEIDKETYEEMISRLKPIDFSSIKETTDHTNPSGEIACSGGMCEVKYL